MLHTLCAETLLQRGLYLEYVTLLWNVVGIVVVGIAAIRANSVALAVFGLDSLIEIFASMVMIWHLRETGQGSEKALRLIGIAFLALAVYLVAQTGYTLYAGSQPQPSTLGMLWLAATCIAMLLLAWGKSVTGRELENPVLIAESRVTVIDAYLAAAVLAGVALSVLLGNRRSTSGKALIPKLFYVEMSKPVGLYHLCLLPNTVGQRNLCLRLIQEICFPIPKVAVR